MTPTHPRLPDEQARILLHTLGLSQSNRDGYRNHFVGGEGHRDMPTIALLIEAGLMVESRRPAFLDEGDRVFMVTERGIAIARVENRRLNPDPKRAQSRYDRWLRLSDVSNISFGDFLRRRLYRDDATDWHGRSMWNQ